MARSVADAFLEAILHDPDDNTPRLVYADWLEDQGDSASTARAEFIRVQCALAGDALAPRQRAELKRREQQLLDEHGKEWMRPLRRLIFRCHFQRGFIEDVALMADRFSTHAGRIFRRAPIQRLHLLVPRMPLALPPDSRLNAAALADSPHLRRLRTLDLQHNRLDSGDVRALLVSEHLTNLTELDLSHNRIGDSGVRSLANSPLLTRLKSLNLCGNDFGANGLRALAGALEKMARAPAGLSLQRLELSHENLRATAQRVIAESPILRRLVRC